MEVFNQSTAWRDRAHCQERFSEFRDCYNTQRPHEALDLEVPASRYRPSLRPMPEKLPAIEYLAQNEVRKVRIKGEVKFRGHLLYVDQAFAGLDVAFRATAKEDQWALFFGWKSIGQLDLKISPKPIPIDSTCATNGALNSAPPSSATLLKALFRYAPEAFSSDDTQPFPYPTPKEVDPNPIIQ